MKPVRLSGKSLLKGGCEMGKIDHPEYYKTGGIEAIDVIEDWHLGFNLGNAIKYIGRCEHKENKKQDLEKALWYIKRELENITK